MRQADPIIGLSQKRIFIHHYLLSSALAVRDSNFRLDPSPKRSNVMAMKRARQMKLPSSVDDDHSRHSSLREKVIEHLFIGELLRALWCERVRNVELLRAEVDAAGYDLAIECNGIFRHIQLKSGHSGMKRRKVDLNVALQTKPSACVIWLMFNEKTLRLEKFCGSGAGRENAFRN